MVNFSWVRVYVPSIECRRAQTERVKGGFRERAKGGCVCARMQKCERVSEWRWLIKGRKKSLQAILVDKLLFDKGKESGKDRLCAFPTVLVQCNAAPYVPVL